MGLGIVAAEAPSKNRRALYMLLKGNLSQHAATSPRVTASHSNSEVKLGRAQVVLPSGRGREG